MNTSPLGAPRLLPMTPTQWPHTEPLPVIDMVLACQPAAITIPAFPRLEKLGVERMLQGMPCVMVDREHGKVYFDTSDPGRVEAELTAFYEHFLADDLDYFSIAPEASPGIALTLEALRQRSWQGRFISASLNGPISFGMRVTDQGGRVEGFSTGNVVASYVHLHMASKKDMAHRFVECCARTTRGGE